MDRNWGEELPTPRADLDTIREKTGMSIEFSVIPLKAKVHVNSDSVVRAPASNAITLLFLTSAAGIAAAVLGGTTWLMRVPRMACGGSALLGFAVVLTLGLFLAFRAGKAFGRHAVIAPPADKPGIVQATGDHNGHISGPRNGSLNGGRPVGGRRSHAPTIDLARFRFWRRTATPASRSKKVHH
jgi:hypothetical protein